MLKQRLKLKIFFLAILFFAIFGVSAKASAATYYVKNGGNDSLSGLNDANAWATTAKVEATVTSGDTVYFNNQGTWAVNPPAITAKEGATYDGSTYGSGARAILRATGDKDDAGYDGDGVIIVSKSHVNIKGFEIDVASHDTSGIDACGYCNESFTDLAIDDCVVHDVGTTYQDWWIRGIYIGTVGGYNYSVENVSITNTEVYNTMRAGIVIYPTWTRSGHSIENVLVRNCTVHDTGIGIDSDGNSLAGYGNGVDIKDDADNVTVEYCTLYNNAGNGAQIETYARAANVPYNNPVGTLQDGEIVSWDHGQGAWSGGADTGQVVFSAQTHMQASPLFISMPNDYIVAPSDGDVLKGNTSGATVVTDGEFIPADPGVPNDIVFRYNIVRNNNQGFVFANALGSRTFDARLYGNLFIDNKNDLKIPSCHYGDTVVDIYNNTFYNVNSTAAIKGSIYIGDGGAIGIQNNDIKGNPTFNFKNNIVYSGDYPAITECYNNDHDTCTQGHLTRANNIYYRSIGGPTATVIRYGTYGTNARNYNLAQVRDWDASALIDPPTFTGGTLPVSFSGTYGTNLLPNTDYFRITSGSSLNAGATLGSPYDGNINTAGTANPIARIAGAYDIGAYEYFGTDTTSPIAPGGLMVN
ncbi:MAG: right-handed parallel beta-helix repeat-containing protein [Parcubacteria group bacterium]|jgi:hypothetical protein